MTDKSEPSATSSGPEPHGARIAVITVHGVGEHRPGDMSKALARQLQQFDGHRYGAFEEAPLILPVDGALLDDTRGFIDGDRTEDKASPWSRILAGVQPRIRPADIRAAAGTRLNVWQTEATPVDVSFSQQLLEGAASYRTTYETVRRRARVRSSDVELLDIYELHWSDLSHLGVAITSIFEELLQLIVHLAGLGRQAASFAMESASPRDRGFWGVFYWLNSFSYWLFSTPIVIFNFMLVLLSALVLPAMLLTGSISKDAPAGEMTIVSHTIVAAVGAGLLVVCALALYRAARRALETPKRRPLILLPVAVAIVAGWALYRLFRDGAGGIDLPLTLGLIELPVLAWLGDAVMTRYERSRTGVLAIWRGCSALLLAWLLFAAFMTRPGRTVCTPELAWLIDWVAYGLRFPFVFLIFVWLVLYIVNALLCLVGFYLALRHGFLSRQSTRAAAALRRSVATCLMAASLPAPVFLAAVLIFWLTWTQIFSGYLPALPVDSAWTHPLVSAGPHAEHLMANELATALIDLSAGVSFSVCILLVLVALGLSALGLFPSIWLEIFPRKYDDAEKRDARAQALANWLNAGYWLLGLAATLAGIAFFLVFPVGSIISFFDPANPLVAAIPGFTDIVPQLGLAAGGAAVGFIAATKLMVDTLSTGLNRIRVLVDTAADVDNWLHDRPEGATPRLKIFARFAALFAHLKKERYDAIVIVAHSQGTVVTTDFFRYLKFVRPAQMHGLPEFRLVTAGSPLRQLYALRFPELYRWVNRPNGLDGGPVGPDIGQLGFASWTNLYGSGDYVGRYLWAEEGRPTVWNGKPLPGQIQRTGDYCIGPQAHTHYLDADNGTVGAFIDRAIRGA